MMKIFRYPDKNQWPALLLRPAIDLQSLETTVKTILQDVKTEGDTAVGKYSEKFDKVLPTVFKVSEKEIDEAEKQIDNELKAAIKLASENIFRFHNAQKPIPVEVETVPGVRCWQKAIPIEKIGLYIPGGNAPLFSTVLMLAIPAKIAGCGEIILCTPPGKDGLINPAILYAAKTSGVNKIFKIGGVQAIASMAYGTETVPSVYKIFGPGNQYVTLAKQLIAREGIAIDMPAGPSEVAVLADESSNPQFIASDLLSQAEHGADSQVVLISTSESILEETLKQIDIQLSTLPRKDIATKSLSHSMVILIHDYKEMMELVNSYAPEHLIISTSNANALAERVLNAGSVFIGEYSPESAGDYASGTNHTLPTNGYARAYSGVNLDAYFKKVSFQEISKEGLAKIGPAIEKMALNEDLTAHQRAVSFRLQDKKNQI
jgi:histidinol dehydrogenase